MKLNMTLVCLTALSLAACGGSQSSGDDGDPQVDPVGDGDTSSGDGDGDTSSGDGDGDTSSGDGDGDTSSGDGDGEPAELEAILEVTVGIPGQETVGTVLTADDATIEWSLSKIPEGSSLTDADLQGADTAEVTFVAQEAGEYELSVTVTLGDQSITEKQIFNVRGYDVPFALLKVIPNEINTQTSHVAKAVSSGGGEARDIGCVHEGTDEVTDAASTSRRTYSTAVYMPRTLEAPATILSRIYSSSPSNGQLEVATSQTRCDELAPEILNVGAAVVGPELPFRISPNGERFMGTAQAEGTSTIYTWDRAGETAHFIASGQPSVVTHQTWVNDTEIAVIDAVEVNEVMVFAMHRAPDENGGALESSKIMDCAGVPEGQAILPSGQFIFRGDDLFAVAAGGGLYHLAPEEGLYDCDMKAERNTLLSGDLAVGHFDVSDDGQLAVFQGGTESIGIYVVPNDGMFEPELISPEDGTSHVQPMFALGGEQVVWASHYQYQAPEKGETAFAEGDLTRIFRSNSDGTHPHVIWSEEVPEAETTHATSGNQLGTNCSFGLAAGGGSGGFAAIGLGLLAALRRRRVSKH